jgi:hypothetical protein
VYQDDGAATGDLKEAVADQIRYDLASIVANFDANAMNSGFRR